MRKRALVIAIVIVVGSLVLYGRYNTEGARRARLAQQFLGCIPDSLGDDHRSEIVKLFDRFWTYADEGKVSAEDNAEITAKLEAYVESGRINSKDLVYFMAQVGYTTFKNDPEYNLPDGIVDHPVLNPNSAIIRMVPDTAAFRKHGIPLPEKFKPAKDRRAARDSL